MPSGAIYCGGGARRSLPRLPHEVQARSKASESAGNHPPVALPLPLHIHLCPCMAMRWPRQRCRGFLSRTLTAEHGGTHAIIATGSTFHCLPLAICLLVCSNGLVSQRSGTQVLQRVPLALCARAPRLVHAGLPSPQPTPVPGPAFCPVLLIVFCPCRICRTAGLAGGAGCQPSHTHATTSLRPRADPEHILQYQGRWSVE